MTVVELFLRNGIPPEDMIREEQKRLVVRSRVYGIFHETLYITKPWIVYGAE